ncbi:MAG: adenylate/guanylate cyclase domain-containing protein [Spirochaetia bacterium]|nr:adenylate/guanylate cyclase domain-containing protein [Spirochaetia bacterium]
MDLISQQKPQIPLDETNSYERMLGILQKRLGVISIEISPQDRILSCSPNFAEFLGFSETVINHLSTKKIFFEETYFDLFGNSNFSLKKGDVVNYRGYMYHASGAKILVQISGFCHEETGNFFLTIQKLEQKKGKTLNTGHIQENLIAHEILDRYIPPELFKHAMFAAKQGREFIHDEVRYLTFLFADLVSFTSFAEDKKPEEVMETLNLSIGAASSTILRWNGVVDKIMGDSVMAFFEDPLNAVISAVEIQKQFRIFNDLRSLQELENLEIRIGIHSGSCIHGSIGMDRYMEWTVIGDAVNSASRLEKACRVGEVLVSEETVKFLKEQVNILESIDISLRGKKNNLTAFYVDRVSFYGEDNELIEVGINDSF